MSHRAAPPDEPPCAPARDGRTVRRPAGAIARLLSTALVLTVLGASGPATAAPGDRDPAFGVGGIAVADLAGDWEEVTAVLVQPDGRIVAAGKSDGGGTHVAVARYLGDGGLDPTFSGDGTVRLFLGSGDVGMEPVALQPDGKVVIASLVESGREWIVRVTRLSAEGNLDPSLGGGGTVTTDILAQSYTGQAVAVASDGKIVVVGWAEEVEDAADFAVVRYRPDGSLDATVANDGITTTDFGWRDDAAVMYDQNYKDYGPLLAAATMTEQDKVQVVPGSLRRWLIDSGWGSVRRRRAKPRKWRQRKECRDQALQMDGSEHDWLEGRGPRLGVMPMIYDATILTPRARSLARPRPATRRAPATT